MARDLPNLWHLHVLAVTSETGSMAAAARRLRLTQPAVTQAVAALSAFYGVPVWQAGRHARGENGTRKNGKGGITTRYGDILLTRAQPVLDGLVASFRETAGVSAFQAAQMLRAATFRRLSILERIVRHTSFSAAAREEGISRASLHRAARSLEVLLGVTLFETTSHGIRATRKAEALAFQTGLAWAELNQARAEIDTEKGKESGATVIGAMPLARSYLVPSTVAQFVQMHPGHCVRIIDGPYEDMLQGLRRGDIDLLVGATRAHTDPLIEQRPLFEDLLSIVMRAGHPLARRRSVTPEGLSAYPWIAPLSLSPLRLQFDALFDETKTPIPEDIVECNSLDAARVLLMESDRLMLLSTAQIKYEVEAGLLISRPHPLGQMQRSISLTTRAGWRPTSSQRALVDKLIENATASADKAVCEKVGA